MYRQMSGISPGRPCVGGVNSRAPPSRWARNSSSEYSVRPMPMIAKSGEIAPSRFRWAIAGARSRRVRSPDAPKMTRLHGGRSSASVRRDEETGAATGAETATSGDPHRALLLRDRLEQRVVGVGELLDSLLLELDGDARRVDPEGGERLEAGVRGRQVVVDADLRIAVVAVRLEGLGRHRVDRILRDQRLDVVQVGQFRVLRRGGRPEGLLDVRAARLE